MVLFHWDMLWFMPHNSLVPPPKASRPSVEGEWSSTRTKVSPRGTHKLVRVGRTELGPNWMVPLTEENMALVKFLT
jgi:hypothetical protein